MKFFSGNFRERLLAQEMSEVIKRQRLKEREKWALEAERNRQTEYKMIQLRVTNAVEYGRQFERNLIEEEELKAAKIRREHIDKAKADLERFSNHLNEFEARMEASTAARKATISAKRARKD